MREVQTYYCRQSLLCGLCQVFLGKDNLNGRVSLASRQSWPRRTFARTLSEINEAAMTEWAQVRGVQQRGVPERGASGSAGRAGNVDEGRRRENTGKATAA